MRVFAALICWSSFAAALPTATVVEEAMRRANDHFIENNPLGGNDWSQGAYQTGNFQAGSFLGESRYQARALTWAEANQWQVGTPDLYHADAHAAGQTFLDLYLVDPQLMRKHSIKLALDGILANVSWNDGRNETSDNQGDDDWWWIDAFYMAAPAFARLGNVENNEAYRTQLRQMYHWMKSTRGLYDPSKGLWFRDQSFVGQLTQSGQKVFWSRGNGWLFAGLARVLEQLPPGHADQAEFASMLQTMAAALLPLQGADGFWRSSLLDSTQFPNPETSGTAFFTYGMAWGINAGLLDSATYEPAITNAWNAMVDTALQADGLLGYVQKVASAPGSAGPDDTRPYAVGAFLLAGCEMIKLAGGLAPLSADAGSDETRLDTGGQYESVFALDASATLLRSGSASSFTWWLGDVFLTAGEQSTVALPRGNHRLTLRVTHSSGAVSESTVLKSLLNPNAPVQVRSVIASVDDGNVPANTLDGTLASRWSAFGDGQWIQYDFGVAHPLVGVGLAFYRGNERTSTFDVLVSGDGAGWTTVLNGISSSGGTLEIEPHAFTETPARFVRIIGHGNSQNTFNSITEVTFLKNPGPPEPEADADHDGLPDAWEIARLLSSSGSPGDDFDRDGATSLDEFHSGTDPRNGADRFSLTARSASPGGIVLGFTPRAAFGPGFGGLLRFHRIVQRPDLSSGIWTPIPGSERIPGKNLPVEIEIPPAAGTQFFRAECWLEAAP